MKISKIYIENFKGFNEPFLMELSEGLNILVGDNESGKSTILEAVHLVLSGLLNGKYIRNELTQYLFNKETVDQYIASLKKGTPIPPPQILIEVFIEGDDLAFFEGDGNHLSQKECGISLRVAFDEQYQEEYGELVKTREIKTLPIEYYDVYWMSCARQSVTSRSIPIKSALIDSSSYRYRNGSDIYISRIIKENLEKEEVVNISQAYRRIKELFMDEEAIQKINRRIEDTAQISEKRVELSVDLSPKNAWETSLMTYLDEIPFHHIGKGEQCIIKTKLALAHKKSKEANLLLIEEPENHLSHTRLNELIRSISQKEDGKQIIVSTHSSFVANKLGLKNLLLLKNKKTVRLSDLSIDTVRFFEKLSGYNTLRLILCKKAILVEGDSDELIVQKAYMVANEGRLPIEDNIDVISVGTSFLRFLEIASHLSQPVNVITDNDGDINAIKKKYAEFLRDDYQGNIKIFFDDQVHVGDLTINGKPFNYNTLEPSLLYANNLDIMNGILDKSFDNQDDLLKYMKSHKTEVALKIFESDRVIAFPNYILQAIQE